MFWLKKRSRSSGSEADEMVDGPDHISRLPTEMLTKIFAELDSKDKGRCARVCKSWSETVNQEALWRGDTFLWWSKYMKNPALHETLKIRKIRKVALKVSKEDGKVCFEKLLAKVTSSMPCPFELTELIITDNRHVSGKTLMDAAGSFEHLVRLDVGRLPRTVTDFFMICINHCCRNLTHLSLGDCYDITEQGYESLFSGRTRNSRNGFISHPKLECLTLVDCVRLSNSNLSCLRLRQPLLKQLSLSNAFSLTNTGLNNLYKLKQLQELSIQGASWITADVIMNFVAESQVDVLKFDAWKENRSTPAIDKLLEKFREEEECEDYFMYRYFY